MIVNQLAIYTQNDKGNVNNILRILGEHKINILSLFLADTEDFGILRLVTEDNKKAQDVLIQEGYMTALTDLLSITVKNEPGDLEKILKKLADNQINIEYMYSYTKDGKTNILIKTDDLETTENALK
jgi:hypothetical protein